MNQKLAVMKKLEALEAELRDRGMLDAADWIHEVWKEANRNGVNLPRWHG